MGNTENGDPPVMAENGTPTQPVLSTVLSVSVVAVLPSPQAPRSAVSTLLFRTSRIVVELYRVKPEDLKDPEKRTRYRNKSFEYYGKHVTQFDIDNEEDIDYAILLVKQVYKRFTE